MELHELLGPGLPLPPERDQLRLKGSRARAVQRVPIVLELVSQLLVLSRMQSMLVLLESRRLRYRRVVWLQWQSVTAHGCVLPRLFRLHG